MSSSFPPVSNSMGLTNSSCAFPISTITPSREANPTSSGDAFMAAMHKISYAFPTPQRISPPLSQGFNPLQQLSNLTPFTPSFISNPPPTNPPLIPPFPSASFAPSSSISTSTPVDGNMGNSSSSSASFGSSSSSSSSSGNQPPLQPPQQPSSSKNQDSSGSGDPGGDDPNDGSDEFSGSSDGDRSTSSSDRSEPDDSAEVLRRKRRRRARRKREQKRFKQLTGEMKKMRGKCQQLSDRHRLQNQLQDKLLEKLLTLQTSPATPVHQDGSQYGQSGTGWQPKLPKVPDMKRLELGGREDYDDWFIEFEDKLRQNGILENRWRDCLLTRLTNIENVFMGASPDVMSNYHNMRDWILNKYGPEEPVWEYKQRLFILGNKKLHPHELFRQLDYLRTKNRRAMTRLGFQPPLTEFDDLTLTSILIMSVSKVSNDFNWLLEARKAGISYAAVENEVRTRISRMENKDLLSKPYRLEDPDVVPINTLTEDDPIDHKVYASSGPMANQRKRDSGLLHDQKGTGPDNPRPHSAHNKGACFYCGQQGHFKLECPIKAHHDKKGLMLVRRNQTQRTFGRFQNRFNRNQNRRSFAIHRWQGRRMQRRRPTGYVRFFRRPARGRTFRQQRNGNRFGSSFTRSESQNRRRRTFQTFTITDLELNSEPDENCKDDQLVDDLESSASEISHDESGNEVTYLDAESALMDQHGQVFSIDELQDHFFIPVDPNSISVSDRYSSIHTINTPPQITYPPSTSSISALPHSLPQTFSQEAQCSPSPSHTPTTTPHQ